MKREIDSLREEAVMEASWVAAGAGWQNETKMSHMRPRTRKKEGREEREIFPR